MPKRTEPYFTIRDVATIFGVTERSVYGWLERKELKPTERVKINVIYRYRFSRAALEAFSASRVGNAARRLNPEVMRRVVKEKESQQE